MKMNTDEFKELKQVNPIMYETKLIEYVPKFENEYPTLFRKIIKGDDDLNMLNIFLDNLNDINDGKKTLDDVRNNLGHLLHNKYVNLPLQPS